MADVLDPGETLWVTADVQTGGRGRRGRAWHSPAGNLHATALVRVTRPIHPTLPLAAALCLRDALVDRLPPSAEHVALKWPNDLLWDDRKIAGILIEVRALAEGHAVAIGFGVNLAASPPDLPDTTMSLAERGHALAPLALHEALAARWSEVGTGALRGDDAADTRARWLRHARGLGQPITVRLPHAELVGTFERMDESGHLILLKDDGSREAIAAGDVFLRAPSPFPQGLHHE